MICPSCQYGLEEVSVACPNCGADLELLYNLECSVRDCCRRAQTLLLGGRPLEALLILKDALDLDNTNPNIYRLMGAAYEAMGEREKAIEALQIAQQYAPDDPSIRRHLERLRTLPPKPISPQPSISVYRVHMLWGIALIFVSISLAIVLLRFSPLSRETSTPPRIIVKWQEKPVLIQPKKVEATDRQGLSFAEYAQLREVQNQTIRSIYKLACDTMHQGKYKEALILFERANPFDRKSIFDDEIAYRRGLCLFMLRRYEEAEQVFTEVVRMYPKCSDADKALYKKARCLEILGKIEDACYAYQQIVKLYPSSYLVNHALKALESLKQSELKGGM